MSLSTLDHAFLAADAYEDRAREASIDRDRTTIGEQDYEVIAHVSTRSGYQGTAYRSWETGEVVIAHRGTEFSPLSPQFLRDVVRADGGMVARSVNVQAPDAIEFTEFAMNLARKYAESKGRPEPSITVTGHSLGGALAQITAHHLNLRGETFNAYGAAGLGFDRGKVPEGGNTVTSHVDAADFVSAASPHFGTVRTYATAQDVAHLQRNDYGRATLLGNVPMPPAVAATAQRLNTIADTVLGPDPVQAALSAHGVSAHRILGFLPDNAVSGSSLLSTQNRQRYLDNQPLVDAYRGDIQDIRQGVSVHAQQWPRAVAAAGWTAQRASDAVEAAPVAVALMQEARRLPQRLGAAAAEWGAEQTPDALKAGGTVLARTATLPGLPAWPAAVAAQVLGALGDTPPVQTAAPRPRRPSAGGTDDPLDTETIEKNVREFLPEAKQPDLPAMPVPLSILDRDHPDRPLFRLLRQQLPGVSDEKVAELTLAAKQGGVDARGVQDVQIRDGQAFVLGQRPGDRASLDLATAPPSLDDTLQRAEQFDRQQTQQLAQFQEQQRQINAQRQGGLVPS